MFVGSAFPPGLLLGRIGQVYKIIYRCSVCAACGAMSSCAAGWYARAVLPLGLFDLFSTAKWKLDNRQRLKHFTLFSL